MAPSLATRDSNPWNRGRIPYNPCLYGHFNHSIRKGTVSRDFTVIYSMTGYATVTRELPHGALSLEIKSVNSRFVDLVFRLNDDMRALEPALREMLAAGVSRGKVELRLGAGREGARASRTLAINRDTVARLAVAAAEVERLVPGVGALRVTDILGWPGVLEDAAVAPEFLRDQALAMAREAMVEFTSTRGREGEKLKAMLLDRVDRIVGWVCRIEPLLPQIVADHQGRLAARLREALGAADDERVRQEMALFAIKIDVAEELSRLGAHLSEVRRVLQQGGACGKRLDFLMQELNREANTLGSKSVSSEVSAAAMEIKILIEQMREQVQNIE